MWDLQGKQGRTAVPRSTFDLTGGCTTSWICAKGARSQMINSICKLEVWQTELSELCYLQFCLNGTCTNFCKYSTAATWLKLQVRHGIKERERKKMDGRSLGSDFCSMPLPLKTNKILPQEMFAKEWSKMKINIDVINIGYGKCQQPREHMVSPFPRKKKTTSPFPNYEKRYRIRYRGSRKHSLHICPVLSLLPVLTIPNLPQGNTVNKPFT